MGNKHVSLFSGIGGIDLAAEWAGFETVLFVESDPYCRKILAKHWPGVPIIDDVRSVNVDTTQIKGGSEQELTGSTVDVVSGGFPCQPFSHAGKRRGTEDDRFLWPEMLRIVHLLRPRWVVAENVSGLLSIDAGMVFEGVLSDLEDSGYEVLPILLPAASVGAPHKRERIFIVAHSGGVGRGRGGSDNGAGSRAVQIEGSRPASESGMVANGQERRLERFSWDGGNRNESRWNEENANGSTCQGGVCGADTNPEVGRLERGDVSEGTGEGVFSQPPGARRNREGLAESRLGGVADGLSWWLDEPDIPRIAGKGDGWKQRLMTLGNAVVPQQVYPIFKAIAEMEEVK